LPLWPKDDELEDDRGREILLVDGAILVEVGQGARRLWRLAEQ